MNLFDQPVKKTVSHLKVGDTVAWFYRVTEISTRHKRDGSPYITLTLMDKSGKIPAKIWQQVERHSRRIEAGEIHRVVGQVTEYRGRPEIRVEEISPAGDRSDLDEADFQEPTPVEPSALFSDLLSMIRSHLDHPALLKLVDLFELNYGALFQNHYGAQKIHHAYLGGLAEHTLSMVRLAVDLAEHYGLHKQLLLVGCLLHDVGKLEEYRIQPALETTAPGGLFGHIMLGQSIADDMMARIDDFPGEYRLHILHMIISHHGEKEFGSPEVPKTAEAFALHLIDLLDSKLNIFKEARRNSNAKKLFSEYIPVLQRRIYLGSPQGKSPRDPSEEEPKHE